MAHGGLESIGSVSNDGKSSIEFEQPYAVEVAVEGTAPFLFHRWSVDGVAARAAARKGSRAKKEDNPEEYVYRMETGELAIPAEYFRRAIIETGRFVPDPRSPRKSMRDLLAAAVVPLVELCGTGVRTWSYLDRRRVVIQRNAITRVRPALAAGWQVKVPLEVVLPEYLSAPDLNRLIQLAGRVTGVGNFRPSFGRFQVVGFRQTA